MNQRAPIPRHQSDFIRPLSFKFISGLRRRHLHSLSTRVSSASNFRADYETATIRSKGIIVYKLSNSHSFPSPLKSLILNVFQIGKILFQSGSHEIDVTRHTGQKSRIPQNTRPAGNQWRTVITMSDTLDKPHRRRRFCLAAKAEDSTRPCRCRPYNRSRSRARNACGIADSADKRASRTCV